MLFEDFMVNMIVIKLEYHFGKNLWKLLLDLNIIFFPSPMQYEALRYLYEKILFWKIFFKNGSTLRRLRRGEDILTAVHGMVFEVLFFTFQATDGLLSLFHPTRCTPLPRMTRVDGFFRPGSQNYLQKCTESKILKNSSFNRKLAQKWMPKKNQQRLFYFLMYFNALHLGKTLMSCKSTKQNLWFH